MKSLLITAYVALLPAGLMAQPATAEQSGGSFQIAQSEQRILTDSDVPAARELSVRADCDRVNAGLPLAVFSWTPPDEYDGRQRIDITPYRNGFASDDLESIRLEAKQTTLEWSGGEAGINYYWRVLTRTPDGWVASTIARYEVPTCPVDFERSEQPPK